MIIRLLIVVAILFTGAITRADEHHRHRADAEQREKVRRWNSTHKVEKHADWNPLRPFSEVEKTGYVAISAENNYELPELREAIASNLPEGVTLVVYAAYPEQVRAVQRALKAHVDLERVKFLMVPATGDRIWARDSLPFPVILKADNAGSLGIAGLVASMYPQYFNPSTEFAAALSLPTIRTNQYFRGGNFLFDEKGNCFAEDVNEVASLDGADEFFTQYFGCKTFTALKQAGGIGDIDERIKFLGNNKVITDNDGYADILDARGYEVHRIPPTGEYYETYLNTLFVNGTFFVPQMGLPSDAAAIKAYEDLGYHAVPVFTKTMADAGNGNIHCVTMNYPPGTFIGYDNSLVAFAR